MTSNYPFATIDMYGGKDSPVILLEDIMSNIATEKQIEFICSLEEQRDMTDVHPIMIGCISDIRMGYPETITKKYASRMIDILMGRPRKNAVPSSVSVKSGRYAVNLGDKLRFFRVNSPTSGRWEGYTFVDEQAGPELFSIRNAKQRENVLKAISKDNDALARYGQKLGVCGMCGRELTDETSRIIGIGPVCRNK